MTNQEQMITPPPVLVGQWLTKAADLGLLTPSSLDYLATQAAQWGADQELDACCEWVSKYLPYLGDFPMPEDKLRIARRPKPPSLKEQALEALNQADEGLNESEWQQRSETIRRALEQLND